MSYYTYFYLDIPDGGPTMEEVAAKLAEINNGERFDWVIRGEGSSKWVNHHDDMREVSRHFRGVLFTLRGDGEITYDNWVEYHLNGKTQREAQPEWIPPAFDPAKLR